MIVGLVLLGLLLPVAVADDVGQMETDGKASEFFGPSELYILNAKEFLKKYPEHADDAKLIGVLAA